MSLNLKKIYYSPAQILTPKELFIQLILVIIFGSIFFFFASIIFTAFGPFHFLWTFIAFECIILSYCLSAILTHPLEKYFNLFDEDDYTKATFEGWIVGLLFYTIGLFFMFTILLSSVGNFYLGLGVGICILYPNIILFFKRKSIFNEDSTILECGEVVFGYEPRQYLITAIVCGFETFGFGFFELGSLTFSGYPPLSICLEIILIGFIIVYLFLCPNIWNKILNFEIKTENGFQKYSILSVLICFVFLMISPIIIKILAGFI